MYYPCIQGWFSFDETYDKAVRQYDNCWFVEIGCFQGKSACGLAERIKEQKKNINLVCVDLWPNKKELDLFADEGVGQGDEKPMNLQLEQPLMEVFIDHMNAAGVRDIIYPVRCESAMAAKLFPDKFFKFIFIDAGHQYEHVMDDLNAWFPKLAKGGLIAGDDFGSDNGNDPVYKAVKDYFGDKFSSVRGVKGNTWEYQI